MSAGYESVATGGAAAPVTARAFADRVKTGEQIVGYWVVMDAPVATERIARLGYDYVCLDAQHGLLDYKGILNALIAIQAGGRSVGLVRVGGIDQFQIAQALDAGAAGVIVPLVNNAEDAARAVAYSQYPTPANRSGLRSYGPMRSSLRIGPKPSEANESVVTLAMIETPDGLANVEEICATPGLTGVYIGPSDLTLALGGETSTDQGIIEEFTAALTAIKAAAARNGIIAGIHTANGTIAAQRLAEGFTFVTVSADIVHLEQAASTHLATARGTS